MTTQQVERLQPGDEVHWTDPDNGECSRVLRVQSLQVRGDVVSIVDSEGTDLECFAHELS